MIDETDGSVLKSFGGDRGEADKQPTYTNKELRIRSTFAHADGAVFSGSERREQDTEAHIFAWDVLSGAVIGSVSVGDVKVASCVAWNEKAKNWAAGCSNGTSNITLLPYERYFLMRLV